VRAKVVKKCTFDQKPCFALQVLEPNVPLGHLTLKLARQSEVFWPKSAKSALFAEEKSELFHFFWIFRPEWCYGF